MVLAGACKNITIGHDFMLAPRGGIESFVHVSEAGVPSFGVSLGANGTFASAHGDLVFINNSLFFYIFDVADRTQPRRLYIWQPMGVSFGHSVVGRYLLTPTEHGDIPVLDIVDPSHPREVMRGHIPISCQSIVAAGSNLLFANAEDGLRIARWCVRADANCDGWVNAFDIDAFGLGLLDLDSYQAVYPDCDARSLDVRGDGVLNNLDINGFVDCVVNGGC